MARAKTSISETKARRIAETVGEFLFCERIAGLHLKSLKKPGAAAWRYRYKDARGKRRVYTLGSFPGMGPAEAADKALGYAGADPFRERAERKQEQRRAGDRTVGEYVRGPYKNYQARKKSGGQTLQMIERSFPELLDRDMESLRQSDIKTWQHRQEAAGLADKTIKRQFSALTTMLNHAATTGDHPPIAANPLRGHKWERPLEDERARERAALLEARRRPLTVEEIQALFSGLDGLGDHWFRPFAYLAFYTGLRPGDLYTLTWQELNVPFSRLIKTPEKTKHRNNPAKVTLTLPEPLRPVVAAWWAKAGKPTQGLVFPSPKTGRKMDKQAHRKAWARVRPGDLQFYALRHNYISVLVDGGMPLLDVARLAGHKHVEMVEMHYGHQAPGTADRAAEMLENMAKGGLTTVAEGL